METTSLNDDQEYDEKISINYHSQIHTILTIRDTLIKVLELWMDLEIDSIENQQLQCEAFRVIGDIRKLFPLRESDYHIVDDLAWQPSPVS